MTRQPKRSSKAVHSRIGSKLAKESRAKTIRVVFGLLICGSVGVGI
jgi:hypothetical protein